MLSTRGNLLAKIDFEHGQQDRFSSANPNGTVELSNAENASGIGSELYFHPNQSLT